MSWANATENFSASKVVSKPASSSLSKVIWRDGDMTQIRSALTLLDDHLGQLSRSAQGALALERFARAGVDLGGAGDLSALVAQCGPPCGNRRRAEVIGSLLPSAASDTIAAQCVVAALRPELSRMARLLARCLLEPEEAHSEMVAIGLGVVGRPACGKSGVRDANSVVNAIWTEARRRAGLRRRALFETVPLRDDLEVAVADHDPLERWPGLLASAVARRVLTPRQVVLIAQTRMDGRALSDVARDLSRPYEAAKKERQRAEAALREFGLANPGGSEP